MTLTEFLLARIAEDEAVARQAEERRKDHLWVVTGMDDAVGVDYDPARVLAECEAKRRIVEEHPMLPARQSTVGVLIVGRGPDRREVSPYYRDGCCSTCTAGGEYGGPANAETGELDYCPTLRALGAIYSDHSDYREEWRP